VVLVNNFEFYHTRFLLQKTAQLCKQQEGDFMKVNALFIADLIIYSFDIIDSFILATLHCAIVLTVAVHPALRWRFLYENLP
jgi:hypothetical protein